jgi:hypothetical protein
MPPVPDYASLPGLAPRPIQLYPMAAGAATFFLIGAGGSLIGLAPVFRLACGILAGGGWAVHARKAG